MIWVHSTLPLRHSACLQTDSNLFSKSLTNLAFETVLSFLKVKQNKPKTGDMLVDNLNRSVENYKSH